MYTYENLVPYLHVEIQPKNRGIQDIIGELKRTG